MSRNPKQELLKEREILKKLAEKEITCRTNIKRLQREIFNK